MRRRRPGRARRGSRFGRAGDFLLTFLILAGLVFAVDRFQDTDRRSLEGRAAVNDGDTLTLAGERIRLEGMDAPELAQTCRRNGADYACGRRARAALQSLLADEVIACEGYERDRYDRLLARCSVNGKDAGEALVEQGWAIAYGDYEAAEAEARQGRRGLWAGTFEAPRDWRARNAGPEEAAGKDAISEAVSRFVNRLSGAVDHILALWQ